ncbi:unnamed protein product [Ectocarpus sp. 13 AM-2016]
MSLRKKSVLGTRGADHQQTEWKRSKLDKREKEHRKKRVHPLVGKKQEADEVHRRKAAVVPRVRQPGVIEESRRVSLDRSAQVAQAVDTIAPASSSSEAAKDAGSLHSYSSWRSQVEAQVEKIDCRQQ